MQLSEMNKTALRTACKEKGVKNYGKLTVDGMRAALAALMPMARTETALRVPDETKAVEPVAKEKPARLVAEERNGVRKPIRGVCRDVWDACDALFAAGAAPDSKTMRELAGKRRWNSNNASIELSRWRGFHGIARPSKS